MNRFPSEITAYRPLARCGGGDGGELYLVEDAGGTRYALKIVEKTVAGGGWEREFRGLKNYKTRVPEHPNLIKIFHVEDCGKFFYYTMEAADDLSATGDYLPATLANLIRCRSFSGETLRKIFDPLLDALEHLRRANAIHGNVNPDNVVFVDGVPKLGGVGRSGAAAAFAPPEYRRGRAEEPTTDIDLYALGKTLYCAFSGNKVENYPFVSPEILGDPDCWVLNKLVRAACAVDPRLRLKSIEAFRDGLHGRIGWKYQLRLWGRAATVLPAALIGLGVRYVLARKWLLALLALLLLIFGGLAIKNLLTR